MVKDLDFLLRDSQVSDSETLALQNLGGWAKTASSGHERCLHLPLAYCLDFAALESLLRLKPDANIPHLILVDNQATVLFFDKGPQLTQQQWEALSEGDFENLPLTLSRVDSQSLLRLDQEDLSQLKHISDGLSQGSDVSQESPQLRKLRLCMKSDESWAQQALFPVNNESLKNSWQSHPVDWGVIRNVYLTASGLKPLSILSAFQGSQVERVVFYDLSPIALQYYRDLIQNWPFEEFGSYLYQRMKNEQDPLALALRLAFALPASGHLEQHHHKVVQAAADRAIKSVHEALAPGQSLQGMRPWLMDRDISFHELNVLTEPQGLPLFSGANFLWISNILSYRPTFLKLGGSLGLRKAFDPLVARLLRMNQPTYFWGDLRIYGADWFSDAASLAQRNKENV